MGQYVQNNLVKDETLVYETKYHWIIFVSWRTIFTLGIGSLLDFFTSEFAITNKRIIIKVGLISRRTVEMNLQKVESVKADQSILGRLLGYGSIMIVGSGGTKEIFYRISHPLEFRKMFQQQISG